MIIFNEYILDNFMEYVGSFIDDLTSLKVMRITLEFDNFYIDYTRSDDDETKKD